MKFNQALGSGDVLVGEDVIGGIPAYRSARRPRST